MASPSGPLPLAVLGASFSIPIGHRSYTLKNATDLYERSALPPFAQAARRPRSYTSAGVR
jgi:hypothetical protein